MGNCLCICSVEDGYGVERAMLHLGTRQAAMREACRASLNEAMNSNFSRQRTFERGAQKTFPGGCLRVNVRRAAPSPKKERRITTSFRGTTRQRSGPRTLPVPNRSLLSPRKRCSADAHSTLTHATCNWYHICGFWSAQHVVEMYCSILVFQFTM